MEMNLGKAIIDIFILILLIVAGWYIYTTIGVGIPLIQNIAIAMFIICGACIFVLMAFIVVDVLQIKN